MAFLNAVEGAIATTVIRSRQAWLRSVSQPGDSGAIAAVHDAEDLANTGVHDRGHPWLDPLPGAGVGIAVPADPRVAMFVDTEPSLVTCKASASPSMSIALLTVFWVVHQATPKLAATALTGRP